MSKGRLISGIVVAIFAIISYLFSSEYNEITGEAQRVALSKHQEISLGLKSAPSIAEKHGGLHFDMKAQAKIDRIGTEIVRRNNLGKTGYKFDFHLLANQETVNAFALPGGQIFITYALYSRLEDDDQIAGVLGHEIGHVVARHGAQQLAKHELTQGLTTAAAIGSESLMGAQLTAAIGKMVNMKYGRDDEIESDLLAVKFLSQANYKPEAMIRVMEILAQAGGANGQAEFFSTHPNPENRIERIKEAIGESTY